jgi:hypothetical protein
MNQIPKASDLVKALPLPELRKWATGQGETANPFDLSFTWKVKGADTGFQFAVYEMTIKPGAAIPIHIHPYAEFFLRSPRRGQRYGSRRKRSPDVDSVVCGRVCKRAS